MRKIALLLISFWLLAQDITDKIIKIEANLFTKIIFLDYDITKKMEQKRVILFIVYDTEDKKKIAKLFAQNIPSSFHKIPIIKKLISFQELPSNPPTAYIAILSPQNLQKLQKRAIKEQRLLFGYKPNDISFSMITLEIGPRLFPVINASLLQKSHIELRPIIFKVAKIYRSQND